MTPNKISLDKKYKTRDGREATILHVSSPGEFPVTARISGVEYSFTEYGYFDPLETVSGFDLIEVKEATDKPKMYQVVVETPSRVIKSIVMTEDQADQLSIDIQERLINGSFKSLVIWEYDTKVTIIHGDTLSQSLISFVQV